MRTKMIALAVFGICGCKSASDGKASAPAAVTAAEGSKLSFFITSAGPGQGGNLGGLEGADAHCKKLADTVGAGGKTWRAYLSVAGTNARDRIGSGPWSNAKGVVVAASVAELHGDKNNLNGETALDEKGGPVPGRATAAVMGLKNQHDILTGSNGDGTAMPEEPDRTCKTWTATEGTAQVGHFDRVGGGANPTSWNSSHNTPGCDDASLRKTGGAGRFYCFATD